VCGGVGFYEAGLGATTYSFELRDGGADNGGVVRPYWFATKLMDKVALREPVEAE
jgi:hypothetical protein